MKLDLGLPVGLWYKLATPFLDDLSSSQYTREFEPQLRVRIRMYSWGSLEISLRTLRNAIIMSV